MAFRISALCLASALLLAACGPAPSDEPAPSPDPAPAPAADAGAAQIEVPETRLIHADPASLPSCAVSVVTLKWDVRPEHAGVTGVQIYAGATESAKLFTAGGAVGQANTGKWAKPGSVFQLRDAATGTELERLVIGGPRCN